MSKSLTILISVLLISNIVWAKEIVTIQYGFSQADSMANYTRTLVDEANRLQNKYTFVFDTKPGAGGAIAANWGLANPNSGIVMTSSAFFIRPNFYPNESYNVADFKELLPQCNAPLAVSSIKYKSWKDVPKDIPITVGTSGLGVTTHLMVTQLQKVYPNLQIIPFKSSTDAMLSMVSGTIDLTVGFLSEPKQWNGGKIKVNIIGTTGTKEIHGHPLLIKEGFSQNFANLSAPFHLIVSVQTSNDKYNSWREILFRAAKATSVQNSYIIDSCEPLNQLSDSEIHPWYYMQNSRWKQLTYGIKIN
jgi:tripartite-type tricarboxylate transporter receptor subunit TctC